MKKLTTYLSVLSIVAILALPVAARNLAQPDNSIQDQCTQEAKDALYKTFLDNRQADQAKAYDAAKKHLACPAGEVTEASTKITDYLKKWVTAYEEGSRKIKYRQLLYNDKKYVEAYALGKEILAAEPENLKVLVDLGASGYLVGPLNNPGLSAEAVAHARKALQLLESGKTLEDWEPLTSKDVAVAYLNYTIGALTLQNEPAAALKNLIKAAQIETPLKKSPFTYAYIAGAYETGPYAKLSEEYTRLYKDKEETPDSKLALANIHQLVDRMIDAYARAVALAGTDSKFTAQKPVWQESLTTWYKFRNADKTDGMNELVAGILAKPLPPEPTPLTVLPAAPASTPANATGTNGTTTAPATTGTTAPKPAATPAGTKPAPAKPDRPRNRRR
jgi:tetratricopeptide (TPR) repeat protein